MKKEYIALSVILTVVVIFVIVKWQMVKGWFSKKAADASPDDVEKAEDKDMLPQDPNKRFSEDTEGSMDCNDSNVKRWQYVFYTDTVTAAVAKGLFDKAAVTFNRELVWLGEKHGEVSFMVTSEAARIIIDTAIAASSLRYYLKCFA